MTNEITILFNDYILRHPNSYKKKYKFWNSITRDNFYKNLDFISTYILRRINSGNMFFKPYIGKVIQSKEKERLICIPSLDDLLSQKILHNRLQDIIEQKLSKNNINFAFRKQISLQDFFLKIIESIKNGKKFMIKTDVEKFGNSINHEVMKQVIDKNIIDENLKKILKRYISSTIFYNDKIIHLKKGLPQGGILTSDFENLYLNSADEDFLAEKNDDIEMFRYADDIILLGESAYAVNKAFLKLQMILKEKYDLDIYSKNSIKYMEKVIDTKYSINLLGFVLKNDKIDLPLYKIKMIKANILNILYANDSFDNKVFSISNYLKNNQSIRYNFNLITSKKTIWYIYDWTRKILSKYYGHIYKKKLDIKYLQFFK